MFLFKFKKSLDFCQVCLPAMSMTLEGSRLSCPALVAPTCGEHQELRTVQDAESCPKLVCGESFSYNTRSSAQFRMQRAVPNWFVGSPFFPTSGAQNCPRCRGLSQIGLWRVLSYNTRSLEQSRIQRAVTNCSLW